MVRLLWLLLEVEVSNDEGCCSIIEQGCDCGCCCCSNDIEGGSIHSDEADGDGGGGRELVSTALLVLLAVEVDLVV